MHTGRGSQWWQNDKFQAARFDRLPPDELQEISRRGGIASGQARRRKAELRDAARLAALALAVTFDARHELVDYLAGYERQIERRAARRKQDKP